MSDPVVSAPVSDLPSLAALPAGIRSREVAGVNGLTMHVLEAGFEEPRRPCVLLLHGFPELAYSWRKVMPALAAAGYHVVAPDQRGYGLTRGGDVGHDVDLRAFGMLALVRDALALVWALGHRRVHAVVGHDFGSPVAAWCALSRPDVFRAVVLMSAPFAGAPELPFDTADAPAAVSPGTTLHDELAALARPRQHYQRYYTTRQANADMWHCPQGVHDFLRAYYHYKSADWTGNRPHPLAAATPSELARLPTYYVMDRGWDMARTVAAQMPTPAQVSACSWLPDDELRVYSQAYGRTGFQGGLQWYRSAADPRCLTELQLFSGRTIDVPSMFVAGRSDWGVYQKPGDFEAMQARSCTCLSGCHWVDGAGHWVQQEQPAAVSALLLAFLASPSTAP